jgi:hypothetical protein
VNACLTVLAAQRTMRAADADVQRRDTFDKAVRVLVENQLSSQNAWSGRGERCDGGQPDRLR